MSHHIHNRDQFRPFFVTDQSNEMITIQIGDKKQSLQTSGGPEPKFLVGQKNFWCGNHCKKSSFWTNFVQISSISYFFGGATAPLCPNGGPPMSLLI